MGSEHSLRYNKHVCYSLSHILLCDPMDCSPPRFSVHGISQARILERDAISFSRGSSGPKGRDNSKIQHSS